MEPIRFPLAVTNVSRDALRAKGGWGINVFREGARSVKRAGVTLTEAGTTPGQGVFYYGAIVSVQADVLHVGVGSFAL